MPWPRIATFVLTLLLLTVGFASLVPRGAEAAANNMLSNPGFEASTHDPWKPWGSCTTGVVSGGWVAGGLKSWRVVDASSGASCGFYQEIFVTPGYRYEVTAVVRVVQGTPGVHLRWTDFSGNDVSPKFPVHVVPKAGVHLVNISGVAPDGAVKARVWFYSGTSQVSEFNVDDVTASYVNPNHVTNPGFETGGSVGYTLWGSPCTQSTSTAWANGGAHSLWLVDATALASCGIYQSIPVTPGVTYDARAVMSVTSGVVGFHLRWVDAAGNDVTPSFPATATTGTGVNVLRLTGTAPAGTVAARLWAYVSTGATADAYVDDFFLSCWDQDSDSDGLPKCLEDRLGTTDFDSVSDTDADGLKDYVEWDAHPSIFGPTALACDRVTMSLRGADCPHPTVDDLFVEVDYMPTRSMSGSALTSLTNLFGSHAIRLHLDQGALGGGNQIAFKERLDDATKAQYYDSNGVAGFTQDRKGYFHYTIMAHHGPEGCNLLVPGAKFGEGRSPGDQFWIYRACIELKSIGTTTEAERFLTAFVHELGHNIFGVIEPADDQYSPSDAHHDEFVGYAMHPDNLQGGPDYHPRRWSCVGTGDAQCDIDDLGEGIVGKAVGVPP